VRAKQISGRKYLYLVEGKRVSGKVKQTTVSYLGPLWRLYTGVPDQTRRRVEEKIGRKLDWNRITRAIIKVPISLEELEKLRTSQYSSSLVFRKRIRSKVSRASSSRERPNFYRQRAKGELKALAKLASIGFEERFEQTGNRTFKMKR
jgi:hypothetical protein